MLVDVGAFQAACSTTTLESRRTMTMVRDESMVVDWSVQRKSTDTRGSSLTHRMPFMAPSANGPGLNGCA